MTTLVNQNAAIPVWIVPENELLRNGGHTPIQGGPAIVLLNPSLFPVNTKMFSCIWSQAGTSIPTIDTVVYNTLGGTPVFSRPFEGFYALTLAGAFPADKTFTVFNQVTATAIGSSTGGQGDSIRIVGITFDGQGFADLDTGGMQLIVMVFP